MRTFKSAVVLAALFFFAACGARGESGPPRVVLNTDAERATIDVVDVPPDQLRALQGTDSRDAWASVLKVAVGPEQPPVIGDYRIDNGRVRFTVRSAPAGIDVDGVELELRDGEVVGAHAAVGDAYLQRALATDDGARYLGEIGIGTNFGIARPTGTILFDEKIGGTVHLALGRSYPETGGKNKSALHWDLICDLRAGGRLSADGEVVQQDGRFVA